MKYSSVVTQVFLSSVARGLAEYRDSAYGVIEKLVGYHCVRMEDFGAIDQEVDRACAERIQRCHLDVFIIGPYYGSRERTTNRSFTEVEYNVAVAAQVPRLVFITDPAFSVPADLIEKDGDRDAQTAFRERLRSELAVASFHSQHELVAQIATAISNWESKMTKTAELVRSAQPWEYGNATERLLDLAKTTLAILRYRVTSEPPDRICSDFVGLLEAIESKARTLTDKRQVKLVPLLFTLAEAWRLLTDLNRESSLILEGQRIVQNDLYDWGPGLLDPWAPSSLPNSSP